MNLIDKEPQIPEDDGLVLITLAMFTVAGFLAGFGLGFFLWGM